jgi:hypothetical protein
MPLLSEDTERARKARWKRNASIVVAIMMGILFIYGLIRFPDAPLQACNDHGYCGKQGQPHTQRQLKAASN